MDSTTPPHVKFEIRLICSTMAVDHSKNFSLVPLDWAPWKYLIQAFTPTELIRGISLQFTCISAGGGPTSWSKFTLSSIDPERRTTSTFPFCSFTTLITKTP